jgi:hypothetical protein
VGIVSLDSTAVDPFLTMAVPDDTAASKQKGLRRATTSVSGRTQEHDSALRGTAWVRWRRPSLVIAAHGARRNRARYVARPMRRPSSRFAHRPTLLACQHVVRVSMLAT